MSLRVRLTLAFALAMAIVLSALGAFLYGRLGTDLTQGIDMELRARAQVVVAGTARRDPSVILARGNLIDPDEAFAQVLDPSARIVDSSSGVAGATMLSRTQLATVTGPTFFTGRVRGVDDPVRLLAVPEPVTGPPLFVVVGATLGDRNEALGRLFVLLSIAGPLALALVSWGGWVLAGAALRPVERMRVEAAAISASEPGHRLAVPSTTDELARLATTLNSMLDRVHEAADRDRRFLDRASHELRTPLSVLKMELDLALGRPRSSEELELALRNASTETDRLVRLAEDLLALGRLKGGTLPVHRSAVDLGSLLRQVCGAYEARARAAGVRFAVDGSELWVRADPVRLRQAIEDVLDNAIRYGAGGGSVEVRAGVVDGRAEIVVQDHGRGFDPALLVRVASGLSWTNGAGAGGPNGSGMGLAIARGIAEAHGGELRLENGPDGGATVRILLSG